MAVTRFTGGLLENTLIERQFAQDPLTTTGLTFGMNGGFISLGVVVTEIPDSTTVLTDDDINFLYIDISSIPTITVALSNPTEDALMLYEIVTASGVITGVTSWRTRLTSLNSESL